MTSAKPRGLRFAQPTLRSLEPASSAVPAAAADKQYHDDNDQKSCGVHIVLPLANNILEAASCSDGEGIRIALSVSLY